METNGDVWLRRACDTDIFVQSKYLDSQELQKNVKFVHRIDLWNYIHVFRLRPYYEEIKRRIAAKIRKGKTINSSDFKEFYSLRMSFADEWGPSSTRKNIEETPCWINVRILFINFKN